MTPDFTNPFRYLPHPLVRQAAREIMERLDRMIALGEVPEEIARGFIEGKMLGVLVCQSQERMSYLAAFSGNIGGHGLIEGFVPPIFDLTEPGGFYKTQEAEISAINSRIKEMEFMDLSHATEELERLRKESRLELEAMKYHLKHQKHARMAIRESWDENGRRYHENSLILQSQHEKAEYNRAKNRWKETIRPAEENLKNIKEQIDILKKRRTHMSDELQKWIFAQYLVYNAEGQKASILEIFNEKGIMPPGGTGDCAAPKLLNHAFARGMKPVAMGEFWYGRSPSTAVRTHGHFYPSCTSKCGPLLSHMLQGLNGSRHGVSHGHTTHPHPETFTSDNISESALKDGVIYEDEEIIVISKPAGMPSVPGLDGRVSLRERLQNYLNIKIYPVHRLDMDTSGVIVFAKTQEAEVNLKKQFEEHRVRKTYMARLSPADTHRFAEETPELKAGDKGVIEIPLSADYDERPRQKADRSQGKPSITEYEIVSVNEDGTTDILFYPLTGRTHQLRVHSAHLLGLGRPILGDLLYGGCGNVWNEGPTCERLYLHAYSIAFQHPTTGCPLNFSTLTNAYI